MNLLNRLAEAKRRACIEGVVLYVSDKGRVRKELLDWEKEVYKVEFKNGTQYVYKDKEQIQPKKAIGKGSKPAKSSKKGTPELPEVADGESGSDI